MPSNFEDYANRFEHAVLERDDAGVLVIRLHTEGGPLVWGDAPHSELPDVFAAVAADPENRVVMIRKASAVRNSGCW